MFLKLMGAMPGYIYAQHSNGIYVNLFVGSQAQIQLAGQKVLLRQRTDYPWNGNVKIIVEPARAAEFDLHIRIPGWCQGAVSPDDLYQPDKSPPDGAARLKLNGKAVPNLKLERGYAILHRKWKKGDVVELDMDMPVQRVKANSRVETNKGKVALMRGPLVYCFEATDNGGAVRNLAIPEGTEFAPEFRAGLLGGVTVLNGTATDNQEAANGSFRGEEAGPD